MTKKYVVSYVLTGALSMISPSKGLMSPSEVTASNNNTKIEYSWIYQPKVIIEQNMADIPQVKSVHSDNGNVVYTYNNGAVKKRVGGSRAWRNNNPGCIRCTSDFGAMGKSGGFAIFPDEETGMNAIIQLLRSEKYRDLTIASAVSKWAPPHENDTESYKRRLQGMTGLSTSLRVGDLSDEDIAKVQSAIRVLEGWKEGKEIEISPAVKQDTVSTNTFNYAIAPNILEQYLMQKTL